MAILAFGGIALAGLAARGIALDLASLLPKLHMAILLAAVAIACRAFGAVVQPLRPSAEMLEDYALSILQLLAAMTVMLPLTYLGAGFALPLRDADLARLDAMIGFDWHLAAQWVAERPWLDRVFELAYFSLMAQGAAVLLIGSISRPGERNAEVMRLFLISLSITTVVSVFVPAIGLVGHVGTAYVDLVERIRDGRWTVMSWTAAEGIITFPSFHTTLGIILAWVVRHSRAALAVFVPLNAVMILATPTVGGHYLVDIAGGALVAVVSILLVRGKLARRAGAEIGYGQMARGANAAT